MSALRLFKRDSDAQPTPAVDLAELLTELARYGKPRIGMYGSDGTWHCNVEMSVTAIGVKFETKSDFDHAAPTEAAIVCRDRIRAALASLTSALGAPEQGK